MVLGERLEQGFFLYQDIIDDTGPLSAGFFSFVDLIFGRSALAFELIGRILILFQIIFWNKILIKYRVFDENTYLPAIIMAALFHFSFDMLSLNPALLGSTFLVLALGQLFSQTVLQKETSESTLLIGIYAGLATGFHPSYALFMPYMIFTGIAISGFSFRQLLLSLAGYTLPILLIAVFYYWNDGLQEAIDIWPMIFASAKTAYQSYWSWLILGAFPVILSMVGYFFSAVLKGSTINQQKQRQLIILWLIFAALEFFFIKKQAGFQLVIFIPGLTYLITQFFLNIKRGIIPKIAFPLLILGLPAAAWWYWQSHVDNPAYFISSESESRYEGKEIMILGPDISAYQNSKLAGPFLNYPLSKLYLAQERDLPEKARLYQMFQQQKPKIILDQEGQFQSILDNFPELSRHYSSNGNGVFTLKD
ncbi:hypothetical protein ALPR1_00310 [Algoriphagus machipongonensis]|uniref:Glycosyltransferase RgtA/B/C/D-like domain-containing protein n=2 Tax=Algoriphagus machipongonensis TaxID=388413 RepID=A3HU15_9BACT|nr:hypothetical protein ALPR1_00310 [Algoriphagus machipongonensis]